MHHPPAASTLPDATPPQPGRRAAVLHALVAGTVLALSLAAPAGAAPTVRNYISWSDDYGVPAGVGATRLSEAGNFKATYARVMGSSGSGQDIFAFGGQASGSATVDDGRVANAVANLSVTQSAGPTAVTRPTYGDVFGTGKAPQAQAQTTFFNNRVETNTMRVITADSIVQLDEETSVELFVGGSHTANARSIWADTWQVKDSSTVTSGWVTMDFRFHAKLELDLHTLSENSLSPLGAVRSHFAGGNQGQIGTTGEAGDNFIGLSSNEIARSQLNSQNARLHLNNWDFDLAGNFGVYDPSQEGACYIEDSDNACPLLLAGRNVSVFGWREGFLEPEFSEEYLRLLEDGFVEIDTTFSMTFWAEEGKQYTVVSDVRARSVNGVDIDGFNTFSLQNVRAADGMQLDSAAVDRFGAVLPGGTANPPGTVPEPASWALAALGLLGAARSRRAARQTGLKPV